MTRHRLVAAPFGAAVLLGVAASGFFDGVLLHQILQWHHLLSLVDSETMRSIRAQILADGLFHALMYVIAAAGLVLLWRDRQALAANGGTGRMWSGVLVGFGAWNVVDVGVFHWILETHHVRLDVPNPAAWDVGWLVVFGLVPLGLGGAVIHWAEGRSPGNRRWVAVFVAGLSLTGIWSFRPPPSGGDILVVFQPDADILVAVAAVDALIIQMDPEGATAVLRLPPRSPAWPLYRHGAIMVQGAGPSGCLNWSLPTTARPTTRAGTAYASRL